jgi:hypothetical protein
MNRLVVGLQLAMAILLLAAVFVLGFCYGMHFNADLLAKIMGQS